MKTLHLIGGEKGGVGKSVLARVLCQFLVDQAREFTAFDGDASHPALLRYYAEFSQPVSLADFESCDRLLLAAVESGATVVDLPAQSERLVSQWIADSGVQELAEEVGVQLVRWHVMDDGKDSVRLLEDLLAQPQQATGFVVVHNYGRGADFAWTKQSEAHAAAAEAGAAFIDLPNLHAPTMSKIDKIDASFWAASNNSDSERGPCLNMLERQRVKIWLRRAYRELERVHASLGRAGEMAAMTEG